MTEENWDIGFARMLKERENNRNIGNIIGKVVSENPLKISILNGNGILEKEQLYKCNHIRQIYWDSIKQTDLFLNDEVLLVPVADEQTWFIVDKVSKL